MRALNFLLPRIRVCRLYFQGFVLFLPSSESYRVEFQVFLSVIIYLGAVEYDFKAFLSNFLRSVKLLIEFLILASRSGADPESHFFFWGGGQRSTISGNFFRCQYIYSRSIIFFHRI